MGINLHKIKAIISGLQINSNDYRKIIQMYLMARMIIGYSSNGNYLSVICDSKFQHQLAGMNLSIANYQISLYEDLCTELQQNPNMLEFFRELTPGMIADESAWKASVKDLKESTQLFLFLQLLEIPVMLDSPFFPENLLPNTNYQNLYQLQELWYPYNFLTLDSLTVSNNRYVAEAFHWYSSHYCPPSDLLADYAYLLIGDSRSDFRYALRGNRRRAISSAGPERGRSEDDIQLGNIMKNLSSVQPHQVISELFFNQNRNDMIAEVSVAGKIFASMITESDSVLIVGPSPDFILSWPSLSSCTNICMTVSDPTIAALYNYEFSHITFHTFGQGFNHSFSAVLLLCRDASPEVIVHELDQVSPNAQILALMPQTSVTKSEGSMLRSDVDIRRIMPIPSTLFQSSPRKKALIWASKRPASSDTSVQLIKCHVNLDLHILHPSKGYTEIPRRCLETGNTLIQLERLANNGFLPQKPILNAASMYLFSAEITIHYTVKIKDGYFCGKACYREKLSPTSTRKLGNRLTPFIEKKLRVKSIDLMERRLEQLVLENAFGICDILAEDILHFYENDLSATTLKTIWICSRRILLTKYYYQESLCIRMFCENTQDLSDLRPCNATEYDYVQAMSNVIGTENISRFWKQLSYILQIACQAGYILSNPIAPVAKTQVERERNRIQEVRNALTKRFLTKTEMMNLFCFSTESIAESSLPRCVAESQYLIPLIRMFTGMTNREICALTWRKFVYIEEFEMYQLIVSHSMADDGHLIHVLDINSNQLRCIPLVPILANLLDERRKYLCSKMNLEKSAFLDQPIILGKESGKTRACSLSTAAKVSREALQIALQNLMPNLIKLSSLTGERTIDLNTYYGDICATNFRYQSRHISRLTPGELNYTLGLAPADTYSAHYADYSADPFQRMIQVKLCRWTETLMRTDTSQITVVPPCDRMDYMLSPDADGVIAIQMTLCAPIDYPVEQVGIRLECQHGLTGTVTCI